MSKYRFDPLRVPDEAVCVATLDADGNLLNKAGSPIAQTVVLRPDNSEAPATVDLSTAGYPSGTRIIVEDVNGATAQSITVTALGSFINAAGTAVDQVILDTDDGFAILDIAGGVTVVAASKGADLVA